MKCNACNFDESELPMLQANRKEDDPHINKFDNQFHRIRIENREFEIEEDPAGMIYSEMFEECTLWACPKCDTVKVKRG